jgi:predicted nucleic acid-binding protein
MRLVVDTNVLLSALLTGSVTRSIILFGKHKLYYPKEAIPELEACEKAMVSKGRISAQGLKFIKAELFKRIELVPAGGFPEDAEAAEKVMSRIDKSDAIFLALALSIPDCAIWSNDKHLHMQKKVPAIRTEQLLKAENRFL